MTPVNAANTALPVGIVAQVCARFSKDGDQRLAALMQTNRSRIEDVLKEKIETRFVGVVAEDQLPAVCYTAVIMTAMSPT
jgi:hypothetical protein